MRLCVNQYGPPWQRPQKRPEAPICCPGRLGRTALRLRQGSNGARLSQQQGVGVMPLNQAFAESLGVQWRLGTISPTGASIDQCVVFYWSVCCKSNQTMFDVVTPKQCASSPIATSMDKACSCVLRTVLVRQQFRGEAKAARTNMSVCLH